MRGKPCEHERGPLTPAKRELRDRRLVLSAHLDRGAEADRVGAGGGDVSVVDTAHPGDDSPEVVPDHELRAHRDVALERLHDPDDVRELGPWRHEVDRAHRALVRLEDRLEYQRVGAVAARVASHRRRGCQQPAPMVGVAEKRREAGAGVEAGKATPVDRTLAAHERGRLKVADQRVVLNPRLPPDEDLADQLGREEPVIHDSGRRFQARGQRRRVADLPVVVRDQSAVRTRRHVAQHRVSEPAQRRGHAVGEQLERDRRRQRLDQLVRRGDHDEALGGTRDDLLARVGSAAALHEPPGRIDLIGAVDRDVEPVEAVERLHRDAEPAGGLLGRGRGGDAAQPEPLRASACSRWATVEPVPSPTVEPSSTSAAAASAAALFSYSTSGAVNGRDSRDRHLNDGLSGQRARPAVHQHGSNAVDRCGPGGKLGPPGHADGDGAGRVRALAAVPALRPRGPDLAQPRPLRAVGRTRLDAALLAAAPRPREGGRPGVRDARRAVREARRHRALPPARLEGGRPPGVPLDVRRRDHDRPARPGRRDLRRDGDRGAVARGALQPARLRAVRLRRVRARRRRRSDGGSLLRGGFDRRPPEALEPVLDL